MNLKIAQTQRLLNPQAVGADANEFAIFNVGTTYANQGAPSQ